MRVAYNKGALVCVTDKKIDGIDCIVVDNPAVVYSDMCAIVRETAKTKSTVIAGSIGKTSTKKMVEAVYRQHFNTLCDSGNDNILDSVGSICQLMPQKAEQYIAEFSEDTPGLIEQMSKITKPEIAIITTIDKSHIEFYGSEENIFNEFRSITKYMNPDGVCIMSQDENSAKTLINDKRVVFVSKTSTDADFYASDILCTEMGLVFDVTEKKTGNTYPVKLLIHLQNIISQLHFLPLPQVLKQVFHTTKLLKVSHHTEQQGFVKIFIALENVLFMPIATTQ